MLSSEGYFFSFKILAKSKAKSQKIVAISHMKTQSVTVQNQNSTSNKQETSSGFEIASVLLHVIKLNLSTSACILF